MIRLGEPCNETIQQGASERLPSRMAKYDKHVHGGPPG